MDLGSDLGLDKIIFRRLAWDNETDGISDRILDRISDRILDEISDRKIRLDEIIVRRLALAKATDEVF